MFDTVFATVNAFTRLRLEPWIYLGNTLLVGEGNMSFSKALMNRPMAHIAHMTATTYETARNLSDDAIKNSNDLKRKGVQIFHGVDVTHFEKNFGRHQFDTIIFQFPNVGSRDPKHGHNPSHILVRNFLRSAAPYLSKEGRIIITTVDSPHYEGVFQFDDAAKFSNYHTPESYPFDPEQFSDYSHTNTNDDESAIEDHRRFVTHVFRPKR
jgi:tRNA G46 methylase TrmB